MEGWFNQKMPLVTIKSDNNSKDFILLHGHYNSWDVGVGDNATGDATMLEIASSCFKRIKVSLIDQ